jgi:hypothetical protein
MPQLELPLLADLCPFGERFLASENVGYWAQRSH